MRLEALAESPYLLSTTVSHIHSLDEKRERRGG